MSEEKYKLFLQEYFDNINTFKDKKIIKMYEFLYKRNAFKLYPFKLNPLK